MNWQQHIDKWKDCRRCLLCEGRNRVVLARGKIPCDAIFVGEAPGESENIRGVPFDGPAGCLLDSIIRQASMDGFRLLFANLVGCFPAEAKRAGTNEPPEAAIKACLPRLRELIEMARPRLVVCVGELATGWLNSKKRGGLELTVPAVDITHPAAILRTPTEMQRTFMTRRAVVRLAQAAENLENSHASNR